MMFELFPTFPKLLPSKRWVFLGFSRKALGGRIGWRGVLVFTALGCSRVFFRVLHARASRFEDEGLEGT